MVCLHAWLVRFTSIWSLNCMKSTTILLLTSKISSAAFESAAPENYHGQFTRVLQMEGHMWLNEWIKCRLTLHSLKHACLRCWYKRTQFSGHFFALLVRNGKNGSRSKSCDFCGPATNFWAPITWTRGWRWLGRWFGFAKWNRWVHLAESLLLTRFLNSPDRA